MGLVAKAMTSINSSLFKTWRSQVIQSLSQGRDLGFIVRSLLEERKTVLCSNQVQNVASFLEQSCLKVSSFL